MKNKTRTLTKTITWRLIGTLDTLLITWFITGSIKIGCSVIGIEFFTKMVLYYIHERAWRYQRIKRKKHGSYRRR